MFNASHDEQQQILETSLIWLFLCEEVGQKVYITIIKLRTNILILSTLCHK